MYIQNELLQEKKGNFVRVAPFAAFLIKFHTEIIIVSACVCVQCCIVFPLAYVLNCFTMYRIWVNDIGMNYFIWSSVWIYMFGKFSPLTNIFKLFNQIFSCLLVFLVFTFIEIHKRILFIELFKKKWLKFMRLILLLLFSGQFVLYAPSIVARVHIPSFAKYNWNEMVMHLTSNSQFDLFSRLHLLFI